MLERIPRLNTRPATSSRPSSLTNVLLSLSVVAFGGALVWATMGNAPKSQTGFASNEVVPSLRLVCESESVASDLSQNIWKVTFKALAEGLVEGQQTFTVEGKGAPGTLELSDLARQSSARNGIGLYSRSTKLTTLEESFLISDSVDPRYEFVATTSAGGVARCQGSAEDEAGV